ncbi:MAG: peptidoglycan DD-metalloendopeptidase family protein [Actinobacteria bacterium]|nr:peptidoglycan DD-metalloendopeptidase family protein [Actinomycetota bacterium]
MARRLLLLLALALVLVANPAASFAGNGDLGSKKASIDAQLSTVQEQLAASRAKAATLSGQVATLTKSIHVLEAKVGDVSGQLAALQKDIALHRLRLQKLDALYRLQSQRLTSLRHQYSLAVERLDQRLVSIYQSPNPSTIDVLLAARSFQDVLDQVQYLGAIANQDKHIASEVATARAQVAAARSHTAQVRQTVQVETQVVAGRAQQVQILQAQLLTSQHHLAGARASKAGALAATKVQIQQEVGESQALQSASDQIAAELRAAAQKDQGGGTDTTAPPSSPSGAPHFIWPVNGPITSPFGMRWGTLHPGIDIGVPEGTPVHAAAAGKVIYCGWESGYGNLVVIDHGGGYATAYGHNTRVAVSCGQNVAQGDVIAYSGCTGFCTGPHVHFEVRVNGSPVDPLGYL